MRYRTALAVLLLLLPSLPSQSGTMDVGAWHGVNLVVRRGQELLPALDTLQTLGANSVALVPVCEQRGTHLTCPTAPSVRELKTMIAQAHARGLKVMLKPHVETSFADSGLQSEQQNPANNEFSWRGEIRFETESEWGAWFENYTRVMLRFARAQPDAFAVGTELSGTSHRESDWRAVIRSVRKEFRGPLVYAAHHEEFDKLTWWDVLDAVGVDAYFPLQSNECTVDALVAAWRPYFDRLQTFAQKTGKPIIFTEAGYQSRVGSYESPWQKDPAVADPRAQAFAYEALFEVFEKQGWWRGVLWWDWTEGGANWDTDFTPGLKPAEGVLLSHWRKP